MTTSQSPERALKAQADKMATLLKAAERGEKIDVRFAAKIAEARGKDSIKFGIVMDDKVVTIDMPWKVVRETEPSGISEYIVRQMRGAPDGELH